jgi:DNA mismatch repair protein MutS
MVFHSILFAGAADGTQPDSPEAPDFFVDLNLDQVVETITAAKQEYNLKPFFYTSMNDIDAILYRQEVMRDLENESLYEQINSFARRMRAMRDHLAQADKLYYTRQKQRWFLDAVEIYCDAVDGLVHDLTLVDLKSRGLLSFREYLATYARSSRFTALRAATKKLKAELAAVKYCLLIRSNRVQVRRYESEPDYSAEVEETFEKFKQGAVEDYRNEFPNGPDMNHVEAGILDLVARLYPDTFSALNDYCARNGDYLDGTIGSFDREIQFYVAYLDFVARLKRTGLNFCYPQVSATNKAIYDYEGFDVALAHKLVTEKSSVVCNDFYLEGKERIFVVSGPNQGGKTTFARMVGQLHYLASLGCPVPGREARLFLFDRLFTHFEREEDITNLHGKLQNDLVRIHRILDQATPNSLIIINEIFASTTIEDAIFLGKKIMDRIIQLDLLCVCVTFIDELASLSEKTVSVVSTIVPENPALRTFKIVRRPADGLAYALSIAKKYGLTYERVMERITS